ncbi:MAG: hypothetical protein ABMA26_17185 [Limisphaerales bacterium]
MSEAEQHAIDRLLAEAPVIKELPSDPEWEKLESLMTAHANQHLAPFED